MADRLPRLGKRELIFLQSFTCNYVVSVRRGFLLIFSVGKQSPCSPSFVFTSYIRYGVELHPSSENTHRYFHIINWRNNIHIGHHMQRNLNVLVICVFLKTFVDI